MKSRIATALREEGLEEARRELENAYIGTIHAFCARILREHPIEAGIDPAFRVLEQEEASILKETALDVVIESRFEEPESFNLLHIYSESNIRDSIQEVAEKIRTSGISLGDVALTQSLEFEKLLKEKTLSALKPVSAIKGKESISAEAEKAIPTEVSTWKDLEKLKMLTKKFDQRGKPNETILNVRKLLEDWIGLAAERLCGKVREAFLSLAIQFETEYQKLKRERASLDFNDLELEAVRLLSGSEPKNEACRNLYKNHFKFVMVDEFQDTSPLQDRLITVVSKPDNLFIVGDWKQSIYGFRGAKPALFLEKERIFSEENSGKRISLVENFRSRKELLEDINPFFAGLFGGGAKRQFEPLVPASEFPEKKMASIEFMPVEYGEGESVVEARMREARLLAEHIQVLVESGQYQYQDFAMLFRVATDIFYYEYELRNLGIPYYVVAGRGFYHQPEVRDLTCFLEVLENPHLDIPLAAILRSPLIQVTDDTLFWLAHASKRVNPNIPLYRAVLQSREIKEISKRDQAKLETFRTFFLDLLSQKEKWLVSETLQLILAETRYDRYVLSLPQGKRHFANIRKLIELAREVENREAVHLGDFVRYVKGLGTQEVRESEAQVEALEGNVVKLMTIHKSKGLEFKAVFLPDLSRKGENKRNSFLVDPDSGLGFKAFNEETREYEDTLTYRWIKEKISQAEREEAKRLLYVGVTRAKDHLVLSGVLRVRKKAAEENKASDKTNWFDWIQEAWGEKTIQVPPEKKSRGKKKPRPVALAENSKIRQTLETASPLKVEEPEQVSQILEALKPVILARFERIDLPVSAYALFEHDKAEYRRHYELGAFPALTLPLSQEERAGVRGDEVGFEKIEEWEEVPTEESTNAADFGTVIHRIFEYLVTYPKKARENSQTIVDRNVRGLDPETVEETRALTQKFLESKTFQDIQNARGRYAEIPFVLRLRYGVIQGTLDLLYQTEKGDWIILDYKTTDMEGHEQSELLPPCGGGQRRGGDSSHPHPGFPPSRGKELPTHAERYRSQMLLYMLACSELLNITVSKARLYFVRTDQIFDFEVGGSELKSLRVKFEAVQKEILAL